MNSKQKVENAFGMSLDKVIKDLHWKQEISINELSKRTPLTRQSFASLIRLNGIKVRTVQQATKLTKNKGENHWAFGKRKESDSRIMKHSARMLKKNPMKKRINTAVRAKSIAKTYRKKPWPQESVFIKFLKKNNIPFIFQYPIGPYIIDFFIKPNFCIEIDTTDKWGKERRNAAEKKDKYLLKRQYKVIRINKRFVGDSSFIRDVLAANDIVL